MLSEPKNLVGVSRLITCLPSDAPSTRTGITLTPRLSAVAISIRTKSSGLSSRRLPSSSEEISQCLPNYRDQHVARTHTFFDRFNKVDARV